MILFDHNYLWVYVDITLDLIKCTYCSYFPQLCLYVHSVCLRQNAFIFKNCRRLNFLPFFTSSHFVLDACSPASKGKQFFSSSDSEDDEESKKKFKIKIKPLVSDSVKCVPPSMDELKASVGGLALSPSLVSTADQYSCSDTCCLCIYNSC